MIAARYIIGMTRPLRIEYPGAVYHVTARGNRRGDIFWDDADRRAWLGILGLACDRFNFSVHAYCQMTNHYHLLVETVDGGLGRGMRHLNGVYAQSINARHALSGHLFQGRYHAVLVQKDSHLLELARYLILNPVRAGIVDRPEDWPWSSYHATAGTMHHGEWFDSTWLVDQFGASSISAVKSYRRFVRDGYGAPNPFMKVRHGLLLGDDVFVADRCKFAEGAGASAHAPRVQRRVAALTLAGYAARFACRDMAMAAAYKSTAFTMAQIGAHFGVSPKTVGRAVSKLAKPVTGAKPDR